MRRRPTSNTRNNLSQESLVVSAKRASKFMQNDRTFRPFARMLVKIYRKMGIMSNNDLHLILYRTRDDPDLEVRFVNEFDEASGGYGITHKRVCFLGSTVMYMNM